MNKKILMLILISVLLCFPTTLVFAKFVYTFNSAECNVAEASKVTKDLDKAYADWRVEITNNLVYNATTNAVLKLSLEEKDSTAHLDINFINGGQLSIWYMSGGADPSYAIYDETNTWNKEETITLLFANGELQLIASNGTVLMEDYYLGSFTIDQVSVFNDKGADAFTSGYVTVEVREETTAQVMNLIDQIMPIVTLAITLGIIGALLDKLMKKAKA